MPSVNELLPVISDLAEKVLPKMVEMFEKVSQLLESL